ncbi:sensor histidine kinase [Streptomyces sp. NPDC001388]|uniref:sensor histidine kinase n=1 Tax=unclassified Streptomyces TaxID=2593676 RepID=UPI0036D01AD5
MRRPGGWWRRKSTPAKVETYTRWSFHFFALAEFTAVGLPFTGAALWTGAGLWLPPMMLVHCTLCAATASRALDWTLGRRPQPVRLLWALAAVTAGVAVVAIWIAEHGPDREGVGSAAGVVFGVSLIFAAGVTALGVRKRHRVFAVVNGFAAGAGAVAFPISGDGFATLVAMASVLIGGAFLAFTSVFSVWLLNAVYELDEARETRARLAVAEERLRFGRDLHDVMGRNLAVIALKSELAVQLARRGRPEAVEQMIEVQRLAQESQREVREVVRGYREADLGVELAGAQGVLTAAGIACEVRGEADGLPDEVQSALGWVVRETTTNVLRHGDAGRCSVGLRVTEGRVVLTVENDGAVAERDGGGGSGLAGLRERLRQVDGTLEAGFVGAGVFRVVAEVPLGGKGLESKADDPPKETSAVSEVTS